MSRSALVHDLRLALREQVAARELLASLIRRDLIVRYKQAFVGIGWAVLSPLLHMLAFVFLFTRVVELETPHPYPIFAYVGLLPWHMFATALRTATSSLTDNSALVSRVYFPRETFPLAAVSVATVDMAIGGIVLAGLMLYYDVGVGAAALVAPLVFGIQFVMTCALALLLSMANLFYRDVKYLFEVLIGVGLFATAVAYPLDAVGGELQRWLSWNPMTILIEAYRATLLENRLPDVGPLLVIGVSSLAALLLSWIAFHRAEPRFAERI